MSIAAHCTIFPDTNIIVHAAFHDKEFKEKIDFFESVSKEHALRNELLPKVHAEVIKRLSIASGVFMTSVSDFKISMTSEAGKSLDTITVDDHAFKVVEQGMTRLAATLSTRHAGSSAAHDEAIRRARIVETVLVSKIRNSIASKLAISMSDLVKQVEKDYAQLYMRFWDEVLLFLKGINGVLLLQTDLLRTKPLLRSRLASVKNPHDIDILCQATSRMFLTNSWGALVTLDYSDIVRNRELIERETLLIVCDPLYAVSHIQDAVASKQRPKDAAKARGLSLVDLIEFPRPAGVI